MDIRSERAVVRSERVKDINLVVRGEISGMRKIYFGMGKFGEKGWTKR